MALFSYSKFKIRIDLQSKKTQGLQVGDIVRRQYRDDNKVIYSLMAVLETGVDVLHDPNNKEHKAPYFIGALLEGDEPKSGELLDFARVTNLFNESRSGAMYLTASDSDSPYMDVVDGMAYDNSLCYPYMGDGEPDIPSINKYSCIGSSFLTSEYFKSNQDSYRVFRITRNASQNTSNDKIGFKQTIEKELQNPQMVMVSYKVRSSKPINGVNVSLGYIDGEEIDGSDTINIGADWEYKLSLIIIEFPKQYTRSLLIDLTSHLSEGDWCEISDLNIVLLSDIANFSKSTKSRVGKIQGIIDPIFGTLDGYGAYFQKLYATKDVSISGTLTAGDENGFASTFYVGRIHKNCLINSLYGNFHTPIEISEDVPPTGVGNVFVLPSGSNILICQTNDWGIKHNRQKYCFSFWAKASELSNLIISQNGNKLQDVEIETINEWVRYSVPFVTKTTKGADFTIEISSPIQLLFTSPQLEAGNKASLYQATDNVLDETDTYGAWFSRGGIGGTIQNPLLRLNPDGSISSNNGSFVINRDGSGHLSNGAITWNEKEVILKENVILKWGNLDKETQENLKGESAYSVNSSLTNYIFQSNNLGIITSNQSATTEICAYKGNKIVDFNIEELPDIVGMTIIKDDSLKTITFRVSEGTESLADSGNLEITISIDKMSFKVPFAWSKAKAGASGNESESLDWIIDWNKNKTQIGANSIITPKIFAGTQNEDGTISGVAMGNFELSSKNPEGAIVATAINGIYGFKNGFKTFSLDNNKGFIGGWDIDMDSIHIGAKSNASGTFTSEYNAVTIGNRGIRGYKWYFDSNGDSQIGTGNQFIKYDSVTGKVVFGSGVSLNWIGSTYIDANGIFTGTLSANVISTIRLDASQIVAGTISASRIDTNALKSVLITASNIEALTLDVRKGKIGGWSIDSDSIFTGTKNNEFRQFTSGTVYMTIGSRGIRGYKWRLDSDGAGALAGGNISWDVSGNVAFSDKVSLHWKNEADNAYKLASAMAGKMLYRDPTFKNGANGISVYNNSGNGNVVIERTTDINLPNDSGYKLKITTKGDASPSLGGFFFATQARASAVFVTRFIAWIPVGYTLDFATNDIGIGRYTKWLTSNIGTGNWEEYAFYVKCGTSGNFTTTNFFNLKDGNAPVTWYLAYATVFEVSNIEGSTTTINGDGIYTGSLNANQITAGTISADRIAVNSLHGNKITARTISADRIVAGAITANEIASKTITAAKIAAGTITASEINTASIQASVVTAGAINGLTCTFVRGTIGGWNINSTQIYKNSVYFSSDGSITNGSKWQLNNNGSGRLANGNISWDASGNVTFGSSVTIQWEARSQTTIDARSLDVNKYYPVCIGLPTRKTVQLQIGYALEGVKPSWATHASGYSVLVKWTSNGGGWGTQHVDRRIITATQSFCSGNVVGNIGQITEASQEYIYVRGGGLYYFEVIGTEAKPTLYPSGASWYDRPVNPVTSVTFPKVSLDAVSEVANNTQNALGGASYPKLTQITSTGIYTGSLSAGQITAGTISADRIAAGSLNGNKIAARTITADRIVTGAITANEIASNAITAVKIAARVITADKIATGVITANEIAGGTITAAKIAARTITADRIVSGAITANEIASRTITAAKIAAGTITATEINVSSIQASVVTAGVVNGLTCTFDKGTIGGFTIYGHKITASESNNGSGTPHYIEIHKTGYICNARTSDSKDFWALNRDGSADFGLGKIHFGANGDGWLANKNITWDTNGSISMTGTVTATAGSIAGFNISGNALVNKNNTASIVLNNLSGQSFVRINENTTSPLISIRSDITNRIGLSISSYAAGATGLHITNNLGGDGAIKSYGNAFIEARSGESILIKGLRVNTRRITASGSIYTNDDFIIFANTVAISVSMPTGVIGKVIYVKKVTSGRDVTLTGSFRNSNNAATRTSFVINSEVTNMFIYEDTGYWTHFYCG